MNWSVTQRIQTLKDSLKQCSYHISRFGKDAKEKDYFKGLLLPQVPIEQGWDVEEFLNQTCMKAGLPPDSWIDTETKIYQFSGQIFTEMSPKGEIKEKKIDG